MADLVSNNTEATAVNLGTISYDAKDTNFNIIKYDSLNTSTDPIDYFTINTDGVDLLKIDIHPIATGDYQYKFIYKFNNFGGTSSEIIMYGDNGSYDGIYDRTKIHYTEGSEYMLPYSPLNGDENYLVFSVTENGNNYDDQYMIFDKTMFNAEFHPHLKVTPSPYNNTVKFYVELPQHYPNYPYEEDLNYVIDITPLSGTTPAPVSTAESHLSSYGVTMAQAKDFIMTNIADLTLIYNTCKTYHVTNDMIAEILQTTFPDLDGTTVANYFATNGIDSTDLGGAAPTISVAISIPATNNDNSSIDISNATHIGIGTPVFVKTSEQYSDEYGNNIKTFNISYDSGTNNVIQTDQNGNSKYIQFDSNGKETKIITNSSTTSYTYDSQGRVVKETIDFGNNHIIAKTYAYEGSNVTIKAPDNYSGYTDIAHGTIDSSGNIVSLGWAWGHDGDTQVDQMEYFTYDNHGNELTKSIDSDLDGTIDSTFTYEWGLFV